MGPAPAKFQPALLGGVTIGVLSALPVINLANCCCAWILFGGALAAYLMQQNHPYPVETGDGALIFVQYNGRTDVTSGGATYSAP